MKETNRLYTHYIKNVVPALQKELGLTNINAVPKIEKIVVNRGLGDCKDNTQSFNKAVDELAAITGQKPIVTTSKKSIANFKLREGMKVGAKVTLRGTTMYEFLDKLISVALPRVRDFQGINPKAFDGKGNYSLGLSEQLVFPEISFEKIEKVRGMDIVIVTTAKSDKDAYLLLEKIGLPFRS